MGDNPVNGLDYLGLYLQPVELANLLIVVQGQTMMGSCGYFLNDVTWTFARPVGTGAVVQVVKILYVVTSCPLENQRESTSTTSAVYTEYWPYYQGKFTVPGGGVDRFEGISRPCTKGYVTYDTEAFYASEIAVPTSTIEPAHGLPAHNGIRNLDGVSISNIYPRVVTFYWDCCSGTKKTQYKEGRM